MVDKDRLNNCHGQKCAKKLYNYLSLESRVILKVLL